MFFVTKSVCALNYRYGISSPPIYHDERWTYEKSKFFKTSASSCLAKNISATFA